MNYHLLTRGWNLQQKNENNTKIANGIYDDDIKRDLSVFDKRKFIFVILLSETAFIFRILKRNKRKTNKLMMIFCFLTQNLYKYIILFIYRFSPSSLIKIMSNLPAKSNKSFKFNLVTQAQCRLSFTNLWK